MPSVDARRNVFSAVLHRLLFNIEKFFHAETCDIDRRANVFAFADHGGDINAALFADEEIGGAKREAIAMQIAFRRINDDRSVRIGNIDRAMPPTEIALAGPNAQLPRHFLRFK